MKRTYYTFILLILTFAVSHAETLTYEMSDFGIKPGQTSNMSAKLQKALNIIHRDSGNQPIVLNFQKGIYHFYPKGAALKEYYISNHDQDNPKSVAFTLEHFSQLTVEGNGAEFIFHGIMLPVALVHSNQCTLKNFSIDYAEPNIVQVQIERNDETGITFRPAPWVSYRINNKGCFEAYGQGWTISPNTGIAFERDTRHVVYQTSDLQFSTKGTTAKGKGLLHAPEWKDSRLVAGTVVATRNYARPTPGIFLANSKNTSIQNVTVHYAYGMGLLAQLCENISLDAFRVSLRGDADPRYFTTQADATHFSGCKGKITSVNGLYEGMMDDAINVHGTYLKVMKRIDDRTFIARYMHPQAWGFDWGFEGDSVQFISSETMEEVDGHYTITSITPYDRKEVLGAKEFRIVFNRAVTQVELTGKSYGIENLTWTPEVYFAGNVIRNNRARGSLFSTPRKTVVENNIFDHTSGTAILLCGDCNGWFETGSCRNVTIRNNKFINALTNMFQFTNAVISIYPEIPDLQHQVKYFHGGKKGAILIENNEFEMFDTPVLYAKSVDGLVFRNNIIRKNNEYKPYHWNQNRFLLERVTNIEIE